VPPAGSRGKAPGQGVRGRSPPEAERFLVLSYVWNGAKLLCLWAVLWSLMVAAVPTCVRGSWVLIFYPWFGGPWPRSPPLDPPLSMRNSKDSSPALCSWLSLMLITSSSTATWEPMVPVQMLEFSMTRNWRSICSTLWKFCLPRPRWSFRTHGESCVIWRNSKDEMMQGDPAIRTLCVLRTAYARISVLYKPTYCIADSAEIRTLIW